MHYNASKYEQYQKVIVNSFYLTDDQNILESLKQLQKQLFLIPTSKFNYFCKTCDIQSQEFVLETPLIPKRRL